MIAGALALCLALAPAPTLAALADRAAIDEPGFTLPQALAAMRAGHPRLAVATARLDAATATTTAARLWQNPTLDVDYFQAVRSSSYDRAGTMVVGVGQLLPVTATPRLRREQAGHEARAVAADNDGLVRDLELAVEAAMLRLRAADRSVEIQREALTDLGESRRIVEARVAAGVAPQYDATRIALAMAEAEALVRSAEAAVTAARGELDVAVGVEAEHLHGAPRIDLFTVRPQPPIEALRTTMLTRRPDLAAARARTSAATTGVRVAQREVFPGIGLRVAAGFGQGPGQVDFGAGLSVPLPLLSRGQGFIDRARAGARESESRVHALTVAAEQRLRAAHREVQQRREVSQRHVEMSKDAAEALNRQAGAGYRDGRLGVLELADASLALRDMRLRDLDLALAARLAELSLRRIVEVGDP